MILLIAFAFIAGVVTVLSPCILPILPIVLTSSIGGEDIGKSRPLGVVTGFILSFTFFTLFLSTIVRLSGIPATSLRLLSVFIIALFGLSLLIPKVQLLTERLFSKLSSLIPSSQGKTGFSGGLFIGFSIGLLWTPCVGPILASVISLAITGTVTLDALFITLAYSMGTAIPMFMIMIGGQNLLRRVPWLLANLGKIQKIFGVLMILTAVGIYFNYDRKFQTYILDTFPQYGAGLTKIEDNQLVKDQLDNMGGDVDENSLGKPMSDMMPKGPFAPELIPGGEWFNSEPLQLSELRGKVIIIDFWTYSCINCQRTFPYLRNWYEKYSDDGLVIIGVHSPEFEFEKDVDNVAEAIEDFDLQYPIVQDNNFATWRAYNNRYWPAKYIIDKDGYVRYTHFGEGSYDETEEVIQELLRETGAEDVNRSINNPTYRNSSGTPETYLGFGRMRGLASPDGVVRGSVSEYSQPSTLRSNEFAFEGDWIVEEEYSNPQEGSALYLNFEAKEVFLVMNSKEGESRVRVYVDDEVQYGGEDVVDGVVTVDSDTLYKLIDLPEPGRHILKLEFLDDNTEVYAFTFG